MRWGGDSPQRLVTTDRGGNTHLVRPPISAAVPEDKPHQPRGRGQVQDPSGMTTPSPGVSSSLSLTWIWADVIASYCLPSILLCGHTPY